MASQRRPVSGVVVPHKPRWHQRLAALILFCVERTLMRTLRVKWQDESGIREQGREDLVIFCLWHNRLAMAMHIFRGYVRPVLGKPKLAALVSASKDGAFLAGILQRYGIQSVRGSSSRRGSQAMLELTSLVEQGYCLAITPDGPRGPRYEVQRGVISLAQLTGAPIIPLSTHISRRITLKSWDGFQIPLPFSKCLITFDQPMTVPRDVTEEERAELREELARRLNRITHD